jgi:hypothetical protein
MFHRCRYSGMDVSPMPLWGIWDKRVAIERNKRLPGLGGARVFARPQGVDEMTPDQTGDDMSINS